LSLAVSVHRFLVLGVVSAKHYLGDDDEYKGLFFRTRGSLHPSIHSSRLETANDSLGRNFPVFEPEKDDHVHLMMFHETS